MSKESSVAPKERINVKFVPATGDETEEIELPMKTVVMGDFTGRPDDRPLEERDSISIDKANFDQVLKEMGIKKDLVVSNKLTDEDSEAIMQVNLKIDSLDDFRPDNVAKQVPEIKSLVDLRDALTALKGPLGNMPDFRRALNDLISDEELQKTITAELNAENAEKADDSENDSKE